jgi:hypothetical protein
MGRRRLLIIPLVFIFSLIKAQENSLHMPLNFKQAYKKNTRAHNGEVGENYWQNSSKYNMKVELIPSEAKIKGSARITYFNNSPDTLTVIVVRLYQDIFKNGNLRDFNINSNDLHDGTKLTKVEINSIDLLNAKKVIAQGTNRIVTLPETLNPKTSVTLNIDWEVSLPKISKVRMGVYPDSSFYVAYWYPQISVYDDIDGWDRYSYSGIQEFYGDFSDFDVEITVPKGYIVWATGELQNPKQVLSDEIYNRYQKAHNSEEVVNIIGKQDIYNKTLTAEKDFLKWKFEADKVTDFAFAASKYYLWDGLVYKSEDLPKEKVFISSAYNEKSWDFYEVASVSKASIKYFSEELPGVPFPYPSLTVFNGSGGMEFPMMVNDGSSSTRAGMVGVTSHEIAHTYFPFMTGINERKYAWMDEGWAVYLPVEIQHELEESYFPMQIAVERYEEYAGKDIEIPLMVSSISLGGNTYRSTFRTAAYYRSAVAYSILENLLGEEEFKKCLQEYIKRWEGKHPIPFDFFNTFDDVSGKDLSWFWKPWFFEFGYPDLKIAAVNYKNNNYTIQIDKVGSLPVPVIVKIIDAEGQEKLQSINVESWKDGKTSQIVEFKNVKNVKQILLGNSIIPDVDRSNNVWKLK